MGEENAKKIYASLFDFSEEELTDKISKTIGNDWVDAYFGIETPSYREDNKGITESILNDAYSLFFIGIYMDEVEAWTDAYKKGETSYFPDAQINYMDTHYNMNTGGCYMDFDTDVFIEKFCHMVEYEIAFAGRHNIDESDRFFGIFTTGGMNYKKIIGFDEMQELADKLKQTKDINVFFREMDLKEVNFEENDKEM